MAHNHAIMTVGGSTHTTDAVAVHLPVFTASGNQDVLARATVTARGETSVQANAYCLTQNYACKAGVLAEIGVTQKDYSKEEDAAWDADLDHTGQVVELVLTGDGAEHVEWTYRVELTVNQDV